MLYSQNRFEAKKKHEKVLATNKKLSYGYVNQGVGKPWSITSLDEGPSKTIYRFID
jgi:hypothetical protein